MPRESFHRELDRLVERVVELGREVESCLDTISEKTRAYCRDVSVR